LEDFLDVAPRHISAALIDTPEADWHEANVTIGPDGCYWANAHKSFTGAHVGAPPSPKMKRVVISVRAVGESCWTEVMVHSPDEAVIITAHEALEMMNPNLLGMYAYAREHKFEEALRLIQEASDREPKNPLIHNNWGSVLASQGKLDAAIAQYQLALAFNSKNVDAHNNWGNALYAKNDYDGAIAQYQLALAFDSENANTYNNWGNALYAKRDYDGAIVRYRQALAFDSENANTYNNWGGALYAKQDYDGAITKYQKQPRSIPNMSMPTTTGAMPSMLKMTTTGRSRNTGK
jgi:Flp pilus assembly protein TadD